MKRQMKKQNTERGFAFYEFKDSNGNLCSLQKSSSALEDKIWLGIDTDHTGKDVHQRMHLDQILAEELLDVLTDFIETGDI